MALARGPRAARAPPARPARFGPPRRCAAATPVGDRSPRRASTRRRTRRARRPPRARLRRGGRGRRRRAPATAAGSAPVPEARRGLDHLSPSAPRRRAGRRLAARADHRAGGRRRELHRGGAAGALREVTSAAPSRARTSRGRAPPGAPRARRRPFALVAVEVDDVERLLAAQDDGEIAALLEAARARARRRAAARPTQLLRERPGRYWVTAPDTGLRPAGCSPSGLAEAARRRRRPSRRAAAVSVGVATCPEDGGRPPTTLDRATPTARCSEPPAPRARRSPEQRGRAASAAADARRRRRRRLRRGERSRSASAVAVGEVPDVPWPNGPRSTTGTVIVRPS